MTEFKQGTKERTITLISMDNESFVISWEAGKLSKYVKVMCGRDEGFDDDENEWEEGKEVSVLNVTGAILAKVIEFCQHYVNEPMLEIEKVLFIFMVLIPSFLLMIIFLSAIEK